MFLLSGKNTKPALFVYTMFFAAISLFVTSCKKDNPPTTAEKELQIISFAPANGSIGTVLVITGTGFGSSISDNRVTVNGRQAVVTAVDNTSITIIVPAAGGSGKIVVKTGTRIASSANDFLYAYSVSTLAGNGNRGFVNGEAAVAQFKDAYGIVADKDGNIYVADGSNNCIRKITRAGLVSTLAGNGSIGFADGPAQTAEFNYPHGVAVDATGNVYVADAGNNRVRKISPEGLVSTLAGDGTRGYADGMSTNARFNFPADLVLDAAGNIYVTDGGNARIRKINPAGEVSSFTTAAFGFPEGITRDVIGNLYVADAGKNQIAKISPAGVISILAGKGTHGYTDGAGAEAQFINPEGLTVDEAGYVYVSDLGNSVIRKIRPDGFVTTIAGNGTSGFSDGTGAAARFSGSGGMTIDATGALYVADVNNSRIRKIQ